MVAAFDWRGSAPQPSKPMGTGAGMLAAPGSASMMDKILAAQGTGGAPQGMMFPNEYLRTQGWDNSGAIRALYDQLQNKGRKIYRKTKGTFKDIYGDLIAAYTPLQENTRVSYETAMNSANDAQAGRIAAANERNTTEDAARLAQMQRMGIAGADDTGSLGGAVDTAREEGIAQNQAVMANWQGLMGAHSAAQQGQDASTLRGAHDQKRMAMEELASRWGDYQNQLAQREAQAMQGARGGGGQQLNPFYANNPEARDMLHIQQGANQLGISPEEFTARFRAGKNNGPNPADIQYVFEALAGKSAAGDTSNTDAYMANQYFQDYGTDPSMGAQLWWQAQQGKYW